MIFVSPNIDLTWMFLMKKIALCFLLLGFTLLTTACAKDSMEAKSAEQNKTMNQMSDKEAVSSKSSKDSDMNKQIKNTDAADAKPTMSEAKVTKVTANQSRSLKNIQQEQGEIKPQECEDQFKNENGICEIPNQPNPLKPTESK